MESSKGFAVISEYECSHRNACECVNGKQAGFLVGFPKGEISAGRSVPEALIIVMGSHPDKTIDKLKIF